MKTECEMVPDQSGEWICTDPDEQQYGRWVDDYTYEYRDGNTPPELINILTYGISDIESTINSYGYTLFHTKGNYENIVMLYGSQAPMIIAECIFEEKFATPRILP